MVMQARMDFGHKERERILFTNFQQGFRDSDLSTSLVIATITFLAEAKRRATEGESARKNARPKKSYINYLFIDHSEEQFECDIAVYDPGG